MKITRELIVDTALALINEEGSSSRVNLREIARRLGCAHTNIYNYYPSLDELLWDAHGAALRRMTEAVTSASLKGELEKSLQAFYSAYAGFYLSNRGWFSLLWQDPLAGERPERHRSEAEEMVRRLVDHLADAYRGTIEWKVLHDVLHRVHCYLHGEVSIFIHGRGLIKDDAKFRAYVIAQCVRMTVLFTDDARL